MKLTHLMSKTYVHPWYSQQQKSGEFTTSESESTPKQKAVEAGLKLTDSNRKGDIYEHIVIAEAMKRGAHVYKNCGCTGKDRSNP